MGVEIPNDDGVTSGVIEETIERRLIVISVARVDGRKIDVVNGEGEVSEMNLDRLNFEMRI